MTLFSKAVIFPGRLSIQGHILLAQLALSKRGCETFKKGHSHKMVKFMLIVYFHGAMNYNSIFFFLNSKPSPNFKPPPGHPYVELFFSKLKRKLFYFLPGKLQAYNLAKEEWLTMQSVEEDGSIIIKLVDEGSSVVV